jgi:hypothetical protein
MDERRKIPRRALDVCPFPHGDCEFEKCKDGFISGTYCDQRHKYCQEAMNTMKDDINNTNEKLNLIDSKYDKKYDAILLLGIAQLCLVVITLATLIIKH